MEKTTQTPETEVESRDTANDITLVEYCQRKSRSDKRVELLGGFHHSETAAGHAKDSEAAFEARFEAFIHKPV